MDFEEFYRRVTNDPILRQFDGSHGGRLEPFLRYAHEESCLEELPNLEAKRIADLCKKAIGIGYILGNERSARKIETRRKE